MRAADLPGLGALMRAAYALYLPRMDRPPAPMVQDFAPEIDAGRVHIAGPAGAPNAAAVWEQFPDHLFLHAIAVAPSAQGRGLGRAIMTWAEARALDAGTPEVRLYTNAVMVENIAFYRALGYHETHRARRDGFDRLWFAKRL